MKPAYKLILFLFALVIFIIFIRYNTNKNNSYPIFPSLTPTPFPTSTPTPIPNSFKVKRVIDGDTFVLDNEQKVRLIGINAPESDDCYASESTDLAIQLLEGKNVILEKDISDTDKYGRLLRYAYSDDTFINQFLVSGGYAKAVNYPPDTKYKKLLEESETEARENNDGLWGNCKNDLEN